MIDGWCRKFPREGASISSAMKVLCDIYIGVVVFDLFQLCSMCFGTVIHDICLMLVGKFPRNFPVISYSKIALIGKLKCPCTCGKVVNIQDRMGEVVIPTWAHFFTSPSSFCSLIENTLLETGTHH